MNKVTIITGGSSTQRREKAKELSINKKTMWLHFYPTTKIKPDTELMVFDHVPEFGEMKEFITSKTIRIRKIYERGASKIERPELIILTSFDASHFRGRDHIEFINL